MSNWEFPKKKQLVHNLDSPFTLGLCEWCWVDLSYQKMHLKKQIITLSNVFTKR